MNRSERPLWKESDLPLDRLVTEGEAAGCIVALSSSERPPLAWAGMMDWRTRGAISDSIRAGIFSGRAGECGYFPWKFQDRTIHVLVVGIGASERPGARGEIPPPSLQSLQKNLSGLSGVRWAVSRSEFPQKTWDSLAGAIPEGGALWISA